MKSADRAKAPPQQNKTEDSDNQNEPDTQVIEGLAKGFIPISISAHKKSKQILKNEIKFIEKISDESK